MMDYNSYKTVIVYSINKIIDPKLGKQSYTLLLDSHHINSTCSTRTAYVANVTDVKLSNWKLDLMLKKLKDNIILPDIVVVSTTSVSYNIWPIQQFRRKLMCPFMATY